MDDEMQRQPSYARGLKLVRIGVFMILLQSALTLMLTVKMLTADGPDEVFSAIKYAQYAMYTNLAAAVAMLVGSVLAVPEFRRARLPIHLAVFAAICFAVAAGAAWWTQHVVDHFVHVALDPESTYEDVIQASSALGALKLANTIKDLSYVIGLITVIRTVRQFAVANEQFQLRDVSTTITQLLVVMLLGDIFYQVTYGLGSGGSVFPILGLVVGLGVALYWIYCHLRLAKFLKAAAILVGEPHLLPVAMAVKVPTAEALAPKPRPSAPNIPREVSTPSAPIVVVAPELRAAAAPRAESSAETDPNDRPKFLS
jgi:hypothetical protein